MKRFYREVGVAHMPAGFIVELDGKAMRTPGKAPLGVPGRALAERIAEEWREQQGEIRPETLPLTRLASTAIDLVSPRRDTVIAELAQYARTDLLCYRAEKPPELVLDQQRVWQPLLDWAALLFDAPLRVTAGILPVEQSAKSLQALTAAVAAHDDMVLTGLNLATRTCGSLILGLALTAGHISADVAFAAAQLEESFEINRWGEDPEQTQRRAALKEDIALAARFIALSRG